MEPVAHKDKSAAQKSIDNIRDEMRRIDREIDALRNKKDGMFSAVNFIEDEIARDEREKARGNFGVKVTG